MIDPKRILVVGGQGRLGKALFQLGCTTLGRDRLDIADARMTDAAVEETTLDVIINTASYTKVDVAEYVPGLARRINAEGQPAMPRFARS